MRKISVVSGALAVAALMMASPGMGGCEVMLRNRDDYPEPEPRPGPMFDFGWSRGDRRSRMGGAGVGDDGTGARIDRGRAKEKARRKARAAQRRLK